MKSARLITKFLPLLFSIGTFTFFATFSPQVASAKAMTPAAECWGITCAGKDPTAMGCLGSVHFSPYKTPEYYQPAGSAAPIVVGDFSSIYSNTCNSNWDQAELNSYAMSQGWRVSTLISTIDSNNQTENIAFPTQPISIHGASNVVTNPGSVGHIVTNPNGTNNSNGAGRVVPDPNGAGRVVPDPNGAGRAVLASYGGETGWPTASNMVDGTNQTTSTFYLYDSSGNLLMTSPQVKQ